MSTTSARSRWTDWPSKLDWYIDDHPLDLGQLRSIVLKAAEEMQAAKICDSVLVEHGAASGAVQGKLFEIALVETLKDYDDAWKRGEGHEKDIIYTEDERFSLEVKTSGQLTDRIYGNRSYTKNDEEDSDKSKCGYYLTVNFSHSSNVLPATHEPFLIRFGWIDWRDWNGQEAASGQCSTLPVNVYEKKLKVVEGEYMRNAPLELVNGVGEKTLDEISGFLDEHNVVTVADFITAYDGQEFPPQRARKVYKKCLNYPENTIAMDQDSIELFTGVGQTRIHDFIR